MYFYFALYFSTMNTITGIAMHILRRFIVKLNKRRHANYVIV